MDDGLARIGPRRGLRSPAVISGDGWDRHSTWDHSTSLRELYTARARDEAEEMTCAAQAAELLAPLVRPGDSLLDVGCGSGWFVHSLRRRSIPVEYWGVDASDVLVSVGRRELPRFGVDPDHLRTIRIEDLDGHVDHVVCMNTLTYLDGFHRPLERLLGMARRSLILRESAKSGAEYHWVPDHFLDPGCVLPVHVNHYDTDDLTAFMLERGFRVRRVVDRRTGGHPEDVIGHPHHWTFFVAERITDV